MGTNQSRLRAPATVLVAVAVLAGCMSQRTRPQPLPAAQTAPVRSQELPPPQQPETPPAPISDEALPGTEPAPEATTPTETAALDVSRADLLGGWALSSGGETCQLFMSLTTWTGGYRASTRGCNGPNLSGISAWDLAGRTVTLKGGDGAAPVATLVATNPQTFNGSTTDGSAITVAR